MTPSSDQLAHLQAALADRYRVDREIGRGGMATVFLAHDLRHDRRVALKVLHPELAAVIGAERFLQEIRVTAQLQHPHIVPLFDSGTADDLLLYAMPYVEGESLRTRLAREGSLPLEDALGILRDVADALGTAHRLGIVHRDIKPENIMLSGRHALVMDFGVARALTAGREGDGSSQLTTAGMAIGTPAYMAPEQVAADPNVGATADLYALGMVTYEMVTGDTPFTGDTPYRILAAHVTEPPRPITELAPTVPRHVAHVVMKCLEKDTANRWHTAEDLLQALDDPTARPRDRGVATRARVLALGGLILGALTVYGLGRRSSGTTPVEAPEHSIAVLPFVNLGGDTANAWFSDGITEEILNALAQIPTLRVVARTSAFQFKGRDLDLREVGVALGVRMLLEGSVQRAGTRVRITAQLIDGTTGFHLWSGRYDRALDDLFAVEDEIARIIADTLRIPLGLSGEAALVGGGTRNTAANDLYLRSRFLIHERGSGLTEAVQLLQQSLALDPQFGSAWAALAEAQALLPHYGLAEWAPALRDAESSARRALTIDSSLVTARTALANVLRDRWDLTGAGREYASALALAPNNAETLTQYAQYLGMAGNLPRSLELFRRARELDPLSAVAQASEGRALTYLGRHAEAITALESAIALAPGFPLSHYFLTWGHLAAGHGTTEALGALDRFSATVEEDDPLLERDLVRAVTSGTGREAALATLAGEPMGTWFRAPDARVRWFTLLGDTARALDELEKIVSGGFGFLDILADPVIDPLRNSPRFEAVRQRVGLPVPAVSPGS